MAYTNETLGKALEDLTIAYNNFIKNAKDQVVQSLGTDVVNEIKKEANAYVSSQIDEKIETKISKAMAGEEDVFLAKVDTKILKASEKERNDVSKKFISLYKNGYIQWPGMPSPLEDTSLHFEGYSWYEVNYDGNFFRAKGRNAKAFSAKRLTKEQIKDGAYVFQDDEQGDAIRNIYGETGFGYVNANAAISNGVFKVLNPGYTHGVVTQGISNSSMSLLSFQAALVVPTAEENRSRNLTFTIWVLVKD